MENMLRMIEKIRSIGIFFFVRQVAGRYCKPKYKLNTFMEDQELLHLMALHRIPGIGNVLIRQLIAYSGSVGVAFNSGKHSLSKIPGIGPVFAESIIRNRNEKLKEAEAELHRAVRSGTRLIHYFQREYPGRLKKIPDAPPFLYVKGSFSFDNPRILAVVGTRQAGNYGKQAIEIFLEELKDYQPVIVSGLAFGIDAHAHKTALQLGLETWAVLGTALQQIYPAVHKPLAAKIMQSGGLISEVPSDAKPEPSRFPERNRIIAGLSDAVWVVEAKEKGGALITARLGMEYFRDVFALPGDFRNPLSAGCNQLIASGSAGLVSSGKELALAAGWTLPALKASDRIEEVSASIPDFSEEGEAEVYQLLSESDLHLDELSWRSGIGINRLAGILLNMEFAGFVRSMPGKKYGIRR